MDKKKLVLIGASNRVRAFVRALKEDHREKYTIAGVFDVDPGKMRGFCEMMEITPPMFTDFDELCRTVKPDLAVITTVDRFHSFYVVQCLDRKISVICEKPLCISAEQCRDIMEAEKRNPEVHAVTSHNERYEPPMRKLKELVSSGCIGKVLTVSFSEMLDRFHGTSYFRRWNSTKANSGGLQFHKSSHHFDDLNWILGTRAKEVTATGALLAYGPKASPFRGETCHTCSHDCPWRVRYHEQKESIEYQLFFKYGIKGGYTPDLCIFRPEADIEDFLSAGIRYENGVCCNYMLTAQANYEGKTIILDGEKGRLECRQTCYRDLKNDTEDVQDSNTKSAVKITLCRYGHGLPEEIVLQTETGSHGGADKRIFDDLFGDHPGPGLATLGDGIQAVMVSAAINESLKTGRKTDVQKLLAGESQE